MVKTKVAFWIAFILVAATGGLLGYYFAVGEPSVFNQTYLNEQAVQAANMNVVLASDADIEITYNYLMSGDKETVELAGDLRFAGKTMNQIKQENPGSEITDFGAHKLVMQMDVNEYSPQYYIVKLDSGKVCIFKTNRATGKSELYLDLKLDATAVKQEELDRLKTGVVFSNTTDVNNYLYSIKN
jgi:hypothetical protein